MRGDGRQWRPPLEGGTTSDEGDALLLKRRDHPAERRCIGAGDAAAGVLPGGEARARDAGAIGDLLL